MQSAGRVCPREAFDVTGPRGTSWLSHARPLDRPGTGRGRAWLLVGLDLFLGVLILALVTGVSAPDPTFHSVFTLLVIRAFLGALVGTLVRLGAVIVVLIGVVVSEGGGEITASIELFEWLDLTALVAVIALLADRRERAVRRFTGLYHEAADRLVVGQELLRQRIAQDLHDGVGQSAGALLLTLDAVGSRVADDPATATLVEDARGLAGSVLDEVRGVALRLHPSIRHPAGLGGALRTLVDRAGLPADLTVDAALQPGLLEQSAETALFRIVQEALGNAARHGHATRVRVTVEVIGSEVHATVADDGIGFDRAGAVGRGIGLLTMEERAARAGGRLVVETRPGRGTIVTVSVPVGEATAPRAAPADPSPGAAGPGTSRAFSGSEP